MRDSVHPHVRDGSPFGEDHVFYRRRPAERAAWAVLRPLVLLVALATAGCASADTMLPVRSEEEEAAARSGMQSNAWRGLLAADAGNVVVVAFYGTWCPAARKMLRAVAELPRRHRDRGVVVIGVAEQDDAGPAESLARSVGLTGVVTMDASGELARSAMVRAMPAIVVIGRDGLLRRSFMGYHGDWTDAVLDGEVASVLSETPSQHAPAQMITIYSGQ